MTDRTIALEASMNQINPRKLLGSKWTATKPEHKEKHFLVSGVEFDEDGKVIACEIQAVMSRRERAIDWRDLKNPIVWRQGWK